MELFKLVGSIVIDTSDAENAVDRVKGKAESSTKETGGFFSRVGKGFTGMAKGVAGFIGKVGGFKLVSGAMNMITNSFDSAISRVDTLNQFPRVLQQMGYGAEEADASIETLADGIDGLPTKLDEIAGTTQRMVTIFGDVDLATESALALNNAFLASGASQADANRGMEQYMQMLSTGKVDMQSWRTLQETMPYALQETAEAFGFAGESAQNDLYDALQSGQITMEEFNEMMIEMSNETGGFAEVAKGATRGIVTSMQNLQTMVSRNVANIIQAFDDWLASAGFGGIPEIIDKIKDTADGMFGTLIEKIPLVLDSILALKEGITDFLSAGDLGRQVLLDQFTFDAGEMYKKGEEIVGGIIDGIFEKIPEMADTAVNVITTMLEMYSVLYPQVMESGKNILFKIIDGIVGAIPSLGATAVNLIGSLADFILGNLPTMLRTGWDILKKVASGIIEAIPELIVVAGNIIERIKQSLIDNFPAILETGKGILSEIIQGILDFIPKLPGIALNIITTIITALFNNFPQIVSTGGSLLLKLIDGIVRSIPSLAGTALKVIVNFVSGVVRNFPKIVSAGFKMVLELIKGLKNGISNIKSTAKSIAIDAKNAFLDVDWLGVGRSIINGISSGISNFAGNLVTSAKNAGQRAINGTKRFFGINSPSRVFRDEIGKWIPAGIAVGIEENEDLPVKALEKSMVIEGFDFSSTMRHVGEVGQGVPNKDVNQTININSPREMNAIETARQVRKASRQFALEN